MRIPGVHVLENDIERVLGEMFERDPESSIRQTNQKIIHFFGKLVLEYDKKNKSYNLTNKKELAKQLTTLCRKYSRTQRNIVVNTKALNKRINKVTSSEVEDSIMFNNLLCQVRKQRRHRGIRPIELGSKDWPMIKQLTESANEFCNEFNLKKKEGYVEYLNRAMNRVNKYSINKLLSLHSEICIDYEADSRVKKDRDPSTTIQIHKLYNDIIYKKTGVPSDYSKNPQKYVYFVDVREACIKLKVSFEVYIKAQFEGLKWAMGIPDPVQLVGPKAVERLNKYMYENGIKITDVQRKVDWSKIRENGK